MYRSLLLAAALALPLQAFAQALHVPLEQRLSPEQLRATGLDRLTDAELRTLDALLRDERARELEGAREQARAEATGDGTDEPVVTRIVGPFQGWSGDTRFALANGQTWRVIGTPDHYIPASRAVESPAVVITPGSFGGYRMQIEGIPVRAKVRQVR